MENVRERRREQTKALVGFTASTLVQISAGNPYAFALYSQPLKDALGCGQTGLASLAFANGLGENFGLHAGAFSGWPRTLMFIGSVFCFAGYGILWLVVAKGSHIHYAWIFFALLFATNSSNLVGTAVLFSNIKNFPTERGIVSGILKGYSALGAVVFSLLFSGVLRKSPAYLLLSLALGPPTVYLVLSYFVSPCNEARKEHASESRYFTITQVGSAILGVYLLAATWSNSSTTTWIFFGIMIGILLVLSLILLYVAFYRTSSETAAIDEQEPLILKAQDYSPLLQKPPGSLGDFGFLEAISTAEFWYLFSIFSIGSGSGVTVLNNLAQIGKAANMKDTSVLLCIFSFCNFAGRLYGGRLSDYFVRLRTKSTPRPAGMIVTQIIMVLIFSVLSCMLNYVTLYVSMAFLGLCYGVQFSVMVATTSELFGLTNFGMIYNSILLGNPLGTLLNLVAGCLYDGETKVQNHGVLSSSSECKGPQCFRFIFLVLAGACLFGSLLSRCFTLRMKPHYGQRYDAQDGNPERELAF